jgi:hypothetical protein
VEDLNQPEGNDLINFHDVATNAKIAQRFRPAFTFTLGKISFTIKKVGNPAGLLKVSIHENDKNKPDDSPMNDGGPHLPDLTGISSTSLSEVFVEFSNEPDLKSGVDYYFVIDVGENLDPENYFQLGSTSTSSAYPNGEVWRFNSGENDKDKAWSSSSDDLQFRIEACEEEN